MSEEPTTSTTTSYQQETVLNLYNSEIPIDVIAMQVDISLREVEAIIQRAKDEEIRKKLFAKQVSDIPSLGMFYLDAVIDIDSAIKDAQTRIWKALKVKPEFNISMEETNDVLEKFAKSKVKLVILHIDIVESTRLSMTLPVDRLATIVQAFTQEMSLLVQSYGGYVLKYVGDAIIAFFVSNSGDLHLPCINAINCARSMIKVIQEGVNPILEQNDYPEISVRIGIDAGENAVVQSGWDIHATDNTINNNKHENGDRQKQIKKSHYDILSYTMNIATKMTALARPNGIVIGQMVYDMLDNLQKSGFAALSVSPDIWNYLSNDTGNVYQVYGNNLEEDRKIIQKMSS
jgi:class 3 adenylate cyclase